MIKTVYGPGLPCMPKKKKGGKQYMGDDEIAYSMILENSVIFDA